MRPEVVWKKLLEDSPLPGSRLFVSRERENPVFGGCFGERGFLPGFLHFSCLTTLPLVNPWPDSLGVL